MCIYVIPISQSIPHPGFYFLMSQNTYRKPSQVGVQEPGNKIPRKDVQGQMSCLPKPCWALSCVVGIMWDPRGKRQLSLCFWKMPGKNMDLSWWLRGKESVCCAGDAGLILRSGRSPGGGNGNPLQYSCLGNPMDRENWWVTIHRVTKSQTWLSSWAQKKKTRNPKITNTCISFTNSFYMALLICSSPGLCEEVRCYYFHFTREKSSGIVHTQQRQTAESEFELVSVSFHIRHLHHEPTPQHVSRESWAVASLDTGRGRCHDVWSEGLEFPLDWVRTSHEFTLVFTFYLLNVSGGGFYLLALTSAWGMGNIAFTPQ